MPLAYGRRPAYGRPPWPRSGPDLAPLPGVCQLWWARPCDVRPEHDALLGEADLARRERLARPADRQRMTAGAVVARLVLGTALGTPPADLRIDRTCTTCGSPHGRPRLADADGPDFSVSHSGHCVVVAVLPGGRVGVDVEQVGRFAPGELEELVSWTLADAEQRQVTRLPAAARSRAFTVCWVRREAVLKATGQRLEVPPDGLVLTPPWMLHRDGQEPVWLRDVSAPPGFIAALAGVGFPPDDVVHRDAGPLLRQTSRRSSGPTTRSHR